MSIEFHPTNIDTNFTDAFSATTFMCSEYWYELGAPDTNEQYIAAAYREPSLFGDCQRIDGSGISKPISFKCLDDYCFLTGGEYLLPRTLFLCDPSKRLSCEGYGKFGTYNLKFPSDTKPDLTILGVVAGFVCFLLFIGSIALSFLACLVFAARLYKFVGHHLYPEDKETQEKPDCEITSGSGTILFGAGTEVRANKALRVFVHKCKKLKPSFRKWKVNKVQRKSCETEGEVTLNEVISVFC
jgi:hypothetical protein